MPYKMRYDREDDVLMIWLTRDAQVDHAEQTGNTIVHLTEAGQPVLLEILQAQEFVMEILRTAMRPAPAEVT